MHEFLETTFTQIITEFFGRVAGVRCGFEVFGTVFEFCFSTLVFFESTEIDFDVLDGF